MAPKKNETALAVAENFQLANRYENIDPELLAELQDELTDLDPESGISCLQIKIPSGSSSAYEVQTEDDDSEPMKKIEAVVVFTHRANGYWPGAYGSDDGNKAPVCSSMDGKTALWTETGEVRSCENCPYNDYGTATDQKGQQTRGKACKNMRRLYLMMSGDPNLYLLTVPPTSIKEVNKQLAKIIGSGTPYTGIVTILSLEKAKNANGVDYNKVVLQKGQPLPPAVAAQAVAMRQRIKEQYKSVALTLDDYTPAPAEPSKAGRAVDVSAEDWNDEAASGAAFEEAPASDAGELPFA